MTEERRLLRTGMPLEDIISTCHTLRRDGTLPEFVASEEAKRGDHQCKCGGTGNCPDCPNRNNH